MRQDKYRWSLMPPLPSYGYGRERAGPRYGSLIHGQNLTDVVITGEFISIQSSPCFGASSIILPKIFLLSFMFITLVHSWSLMVLLATQQDTMVPSMDKARHGGQSTERIF